MVSDYLGAARHKLRRFGKLGGGTEGQILLPFVDRGRGNLVTFPEYERKNTGLRGW